MALKQRQQMERTVVRVDEVDIANRTAHVVDKTGSTFKVGFWKLDTAAQVPAQNERWVIARQGSQWHLERRWDRPGESSIFDGLSPGDARLRVPGWLYLNANRFGATTWEQFVTNGVTTSFTLTEEPVLLDTVMVFNHTGLLIDPTTYTLVSNVLTLGSAPAAAKITVYYQRV